MTLLKVNHTKFNKSFLNILSAALLCLVIFYFCYGYLTLVSELFQQQTGDEKWFRDRSWIQVTDQWIAVYGYYRILGIWFLKFGIDALPIGSSRLFILPFLFFSSYGFLIASSQKFLNLPTRFCPWYFLLPLATPFWLPTIIEPCRLLQDGAVYVISGIFLMLYKKYDQHYMKIILLAFYIVISSLIYESCVPFIIALIITEKHFKLGNLFGALALSTAVALLIRPEWRNPKIAKSLQAVDAGKSSISVSDIGMYVSNKLNILFTAHIDYFFLVFLIVSLIMAHHMIANFGGENVIEKWKFKALILISGLIPLFFIVLMNFRTEKISIPWTIYFLSFTAFSIGFTAEYFEKKFCYSLYAICSVLIFMSFTSNLKGSHEYYRNCQFNLLSKTLYSNFYKEYGFINCKN